MKQATEPATSPCNVGYLKAALLISRKHTVYAQKAAKGFAKFKVCPKFLQRFAGYQHWSPAPLSSCFRSQLMICIQNETSKFLQL